jgi:cardiolipin synthase A/B
LLTHLFENWQYYALAGLEVIVVLVASAHVVLTKRDSRGAIAWIGLIWLVPLLGACLYVLLGVNRIQRRARSLRSRYPHPKPQLIMQACTPEEMDEVFGAAAMHLRSVTTLTGKVTQRPLLGGNLVVPLLDGDQAFPEMLSAIDSATESVTLSTYIFDNDRVGNLFIEALKRAVDRNVAVRVLIDDMGARYSWPTTVKTLHRAGVNCSTFMPPFIPWRFQYSNLRNHRKTLVIDGNEH